MSNLDNLKHEINQLIQVNQSENMRAIKPAPEYEKVWFPTPEHVKIQALLHQLKGKFMIELPILKVLNFVKRNRMTPIQLGKFHIDV